MKMNKILLLMVVLLGMFGLNGTTVLAEGADPFLIYNQTTFQEFADNYGQEGYQNAKLTASFTLDDSFSQITNFSGSFDGNGQTITMGDTTNPCSKGIFDTVATGGVVKNLTVDGFIIGSSYYVGGIAAENNGSITGCSVSGSVKGTVANAGGIAGENGGSIAGCTVSASVKSILYTGGIAGYNVVSISGCTVSGSVEGYYVGGIAGENDDSIAGCTVTGSVEGTGTNIGGIAGENYLYGTLTNAYCLKDSTNNINPGLYDIGYDTSYGTNEDNATQFTSGQIAWELRLWQETNPLTGTNLLWGQTLGTADDTYPVLTTDPAQAVYQLSFKRAGAADIDDTLSVYLNPGQPFTFTDEQKVSDGYSWVDTAGTEYNTSYTMPGLSDTPAPADMLLKESKEPTDVSVTSSAHAVVNDQEPVAFTITNSSTSPATFRWKLNDGTWSTAITVTGGDQSSFDVTLTASNPTIYIQQEVGTDGWSLSKAVPFTITCLKTDDTNHDTIEIGSPADFNAFATYINNGWDAATTIKNAILTASFTLDDSFSQMINFSGSFDGNGQTITMGTTTNPCSKSVFYTITADGEVKNLTVAGFIKGSDPQTGGIAAINQGTITGCTVSASVSNTNGPNSYIGGIAGWSIGGLISNCRVTGTVKGISYIGGIVGQNENTAGISGCTVSGSVEGLFRVGGIAGVMTAPTGTATIENCASQATITCTSDEVGGIVGTTNGIFTIKNVYFNGTINAASATYVGGIVGRNYGSSSISSSYYPQNASYKGIGADSPANIPADTDEIYPVSDFTTGQVAWSLRTYQNANYTISNDTPVWGQLLSNYGAEPKDPAPALNAVSDGTAYNIRQLHQLLFYQSEADKSAGTPDDTLTCYASDGGTAVNYPVPATGYCWINGTTEFKSTDAVTSDLQLVKTAVASPPGGGGTTTPAMTGISVQPVIIYLGQTLTADDFGITGLPAGAVVTFSSNGSNFNTDPPMPDQGGTNTFTIQITAPGYQTYSVTTTVTVLPNAIVLNPLANGSGSRPTNLSGGGFGIPYSFDLDAFLSGDATSDASAKAITSLSAASVTAYAIDSIDDPCCLLADGDNAPSISDSGLFSCYLNYATASSSGQTATETSGNTETSSETAAVVSTESTNNMDGMNASGDDASDTSDTVMLCATVLINVTLESGDITPITLDIEIPQRLYNIDYRTHIQNIGWENDFIENGQMSGTQGQGLRLEAIEIKTDSDYDLGVSYRTHVQNIGWEENYVSDGQESGTDGQGLRLEAIELSLTGADADYFDIYYQVHVQNLGWLDWASNGAPAGSAGFGYRLEGIRIVVVPKGAEAPGATDKCFIEQ